MHAMTVLS